MNGLKISVLPKTMNHVAFQTNWIIHLNFGCVVELVIVSRVVASVRLCNRAIVRSFRLQSIHDCNKDAREWTWFDTLYLGIHQFTPQLIMGFAAWPLIIANNHLFAIKFAHLWPIAKAVVSRPKTRNGCALACIQTDKRGISDTWTLGHLDTWTLEVAWSAFPTLCCQKNHFFPWPFPFPFPFHFHAPISYARRGGPISP